jgi:hypothetical protein
MTTYLLVHGAFVGEGWSWCKVKLNHKRLILPVLRSESIPIRMPIARNLDRSAKFA